MDFAVVNSAPGQCEKCRGKGVYVWGGSVNGVPRHSGMCYSCKGTGEQTTKDMNRNSYYNSKKVVYI